MLAFSHSKLKDVVGTDALRSVLTGQYREMVTGSTLHLQVVWDLLYDQPGFIAEDAKPPLCALKIWEKDLRVETKLPDTMAELGATEIMALASHCAVPKEQRQRIFNPQGARERAKATVAIGELPASTAMASTRKPLLEAVCALVAVVGLGFAIYSVVGFFSGAKFESVGVDEISSVLPVKSARKLGSEVNVVLSDDSWLDKSAGERSEALEEALSQLKAREVEVLIITDSGGTMRASAQWTGSPESIEVRLH